MIRGAPKILARGRRDDSLVHVGAMAQADMLVEAAYVGAAVIIGGVLGALVFGATGALAGAIVVPVGLYFYMQGSSGLAGA
jgi:hypothetical protein